MTTLNRRSLLQSGLFLGAAGLSAPLPAWSRTASPDPTPLPSTAEILATVAPELRPKAEEMLKMSPPLGGDNAGNIKALREASSKWVIPPAASPKFERRMIPGPKGAPEVAVYIINAQPAGAMKPLLLHIHGGGFIVETAESQVAALQKTCEELDCIAVTVDYRLAPESPFPGSLEDNYAALRWLHASAHELGGDKRRIAVMGESAGGGHAAMLALAARDRHEFQLLAQILIYPMLDDRTGSTRVVPRTVGNIVWTPQLNRLGWRSLLGVPAGSNRVPAGSVPAREESLAGLPPTFIGVGAIDLFVEEDIQYAQRLIAAGVPTELLVIPGAFHGFDMIVPDAPQSRQFRTAWTSMLRSAFAAAAS